MRKLAKVVTWCAGIVVLLLAAGWFAARPTTPDAFYAWDGGVAQPGQLLRAEPYTLDLPSGAKAWRILYGTTRFSGAAAVASGIVMVGENAKSTQPIVAWAHGTTGIAPGCAPSVTLPFANVPAVRELLDAGWAYVATDYVGLGTGGGHAYLIGDDAARNVLDAIRAAKQLPGLNLAREAVVWGHSQGGNSALWTGVIARTYAPDIDVKGIAALAPASDLGALMQSAKSGMFGKIVSSYVVHAFGMFYDEVGSSNLLATAARPLVADIAGRCVGGLGTLFSVAETFLLPSGGIFAADPGSTALGQRLADNSPRGPFPMPVLLAQGEKDDLVLETVQQNYVRARCAEGRPLDYRVIAGRDHISLVALDSPLVLILIDWTKKRFAGEPAPNGC